MVYYLRYESDGTTYNDDNLNDDILDMVTDKLDEILPATSVSYNDITISENAVHIDGMFEEVDTFVPLDEEKLGIDLFPSTRYEYTLSR